MEYYGVLPKEARLQLLIEADYSTILELCQEPLFKDLCQSKILWNEKLFREFGVRSNNPKEDYKYHYLNNIKNKRKELDQKMTELLMGTTEDPGEIKRKLAKLEEYNKIMEDLLKLENMFLYLDVVPNPKQLVVKSKNLSEKDWDEIFVSLYSVGLDSYQQAQIGDYTIFIYETAKDVEIAKKALGNEYQFLY